MRNAWYSKLAWRRMGLHQMCTLLLLFALYLCLLSPGPCWPSCMLSKVYLLFTPWHIFGCVNKRCALSHVPIWVVILQRLHHRLLQSPKSPPPPKPNSGVPVITGVASCSLQHSILSVWVDFILVHVCVCVCVCLLLHVVWRDLANTTWHTQL